MITILGSTTVTAILGTGIDASDHAQVKAFIHAAAANGLHVMFIVPGTKRPSDLRTSRQRTNDDKAAQEAAREAGRSDWANVKSASGLALATTNTSRLDSYLKAYAKRYGDDAHVNLAIELGGSRLVVVDCDTAAQREHFLEISGAPADLPPTVVTPGMRDEDGVMVHSDGGHYYFTVPEGVELPTETGAYTWGAGDGAFAVLWDRRYVLIPPSVRPEGAYEVVGRDYELPDWLAEKITEVTSARAERFARSNDHADGELTEVIDAWADQVSWASILEPVGWTRTARPDSCGCDAWTAPGEHANPRSATTHDAGCSLGRYTETNAPMHIWTDHDIEPFTEWVTESKSSTLSKLQAVAVTTFDGSMSRAIEELDLAPEPVTMDAEDGLSDSNLDSTDTGSIDDRLPTREELEAAIADSQPTETENAPEDEAESQDAPAQPEAHDEGDIVTFSLGDLDAAPFPDEIDPEEDGVYPSSVDGLPTIAVFDYWRAVPPPEYIIDGLIEHRGLSCVIGPPGVGKSTVALDMACHIATGRRWQGKPTLQTKVLYMPGEGLSGVVQRITAWEQAHGVTVNDQMLIADDVIHLKAHRDAWVALMALVSQLGIGLIIFDTFARMSSGLEENSATDVGRAVRRIDEVRKAANCGALLVHHTSKASPGQARGSSALNGALDSEILIAPGDWDYDSIGLDADDLPQGKRIQLDTTKQKNAPQLDDPMPLLMTSWERNDSVIITGPTGTLDPLASEVVLASPIPEPVIETAVRIRRHLERFTQQGLTRGELAHQISPDAYTHRRDDAARYWKQRIAEAVDRGLRYGLIETLTGTASGSRYIPSVTSIETARQLAAAEVIGDDYGDDD